MADKYPPPTTDAPLDQMGADLVNGFAALGKDPEGAKKLFEALKPQLGSFSGKSYDRDRPPLQNIGHKK